MDSFGDYIYLILIAIAALSGIFKKKKEKPVPLDDTDSTPDDFEDILKELMPEKNVPPTAQPIPINDSKAKANTTILSYENTTDFSKLKAKKHVNRQPSENQMRETEKLILDEERDAENQITMHTPADARKAFIYAEIFNKKY